MPSSQLAYVLMLIFAMYLSPKPPRRTIDAGDFLPLLEALAPQGWLPSVQLPCLRRRAFCGTPTKGHFMGAPPDTGCCTLCSVAASVAVSLLAGRQIPFHASSDPSQR
eukprot:10859258-Alexandrium_andersonii.AAC.1